MDSIRSRVLEAALATIDEMNEYLPVERRLERSATLKLFGEGGGLDSLGLVNFLLSLEGRIADSFDQTISLADDRAFSQRSSPFRSVTSLTDYAAHLLEETRTDV